MLNLCQKRDGENTISLLSKIGDCCAIPNSNNHIASQHCDFIAGNGTMPSLVNLLSAILSLRSWPKSQAMSGCCWIWDICHQGCCRAPATYCLLLRLRCRCRLPGNLRSVMVYGAANQVNQALIVIVDAATFAGSVISVRSIP